MTVRQTIALWGGRVTARLPAKLNQNLWRALRLAKSQPVYRLTGRTRAGTMGTVIAAGHGPATNYLPSTFFGEYPKQELIRSVPVYKLSPVLRSLREEADLTVVRLDTFLAQNLFGREYLRVPEWVRTSIPLPVDLVQTNARNGSLKQDLRLGRKYGFTSVESHSETDLVEFYETMFRPHTIGRHHSEDYLKTADELKAQLPYGCLLWIMLDGQRVGGMLVTHKEGNFHLAATGVRQGDESLLRKGVLSACYFQAMQYANKTNCTKLDFGGTRPSLNDGLLHYKRKWGARLNADESNNIRLLTYWPNTTPAIAAMLKHAPLIFFENGQVSAVNGDAATPFTPDVTRGVNQLYAVRPDSTMRDWIEQPVVEEVFKPVPQPAKKSKPAPFTQTNDLDAADLPND